MIPGTFSDFRDKRWIADGRGKKTIGIIYYGIQPDQDSDCFSDLTEPTQEMNRTRQNGITQIKIPIVP